MLAAYISAAFCQRRYNNLIYSQIIYTDSSADNIDNGVNCTHLMKMHLFNGKAVSLRLCLRNKQKHFSGQIFYMFIGIQSINNGIDIMQIAMFMTVRMSMAVLVGMTVCMIVNVLMIVVMFMIMAVFMVVTMLMVMFMIMAVFVLQMHIKVKGIQSAGHFSSKVQMISIHLHTVKHPFQLFLIRPQIQQSSYRHIAADS